MADVNDLHDLLPRSRIIKLKALCEHLLLDLGTFVRAYLSTLPGGLPAATAPSQAPTTTSLIRRLEELFSRIDTFGAGRVSWSQLTAYVQDAAAGAVTGRRGGAPFVFRPSKKLEVPDNHTLPKAGVRFARWVPEQQLLLVGFHHSLALHVFSHKARLLALLHANTPPDQLVMGGRAAAGGDSGLFSSTAGALGGGGSGGCGRRQRRRRDRQRQQQRTAFARLCRGAWRAAGKDADVGA